jgi:hypothetical protein
MKIKPLPSTTLKSVPSMRTYNVVGQIHHPQEMKPLFWRPALCKNRIFRSSFVSYIIPLPKTLAATVSKKTNPSPTTTAQEYGNSLFPAPHSLKSYRRHHSPPHSQQPSSSSRPRA